MTSLRDPLEFSCVNCEAPIRGDVTFFVGLAFCCAGCVAGGPCTCSYDADVPAQRRLRPRVPADVTSEGSDAPDVADEPQAVPAAPRAMPAEPPVMAPSRMGDLTPVG